MTIFIPTMSSIHLTNRSVFLEHDNPKQILGVDADERQRANAVPMI